MRTGFNGTVPKDVRELRCRLKIHELQGIDLAKQEMVKRKC
jgi:hypothetical protein